MSYARAAMAKLPDLSRLFQAVAEADLMRARNLANAMVLAEEKAGRHGAAAKLRGALASTGPVAESRAHSEPTTLSPISLPDVLTSFDLPCRLDSVELANNTRHLLTEFLDEHRNTLVLAQHGLQPRRRIFLHGPPGCGKTVTARAIATELAMPLFIVRFDALVGAYLGQTSARIRDVFRFAEVERAVVLIDEIDAVGRRRGRRSDVGELDRVVISLMQQLDLVRPAGIVAAASNIPAEIDPALLRRFDIMVEFSLPSAARLRSFAARLAHQRGFVLDAATRRELARARTFADVEVVIVQQHRRAVLRGV